MAIGMLKKHPTRATSRAHDARAPEADLSLTRLRQRLRVSDLLQRTLDPELLVGAFLDALAELIAFDGARFKCADFPLELHRGRTARHRCTYALTVESTPLGELQLSRKTRFTNAELETLEDMLSGLTYPLRNALTHQRALRASLVDPLTGACNRGAFEIALSRELGLARRHGTPLSLILLDIDYFKAINDQHGHHSGDKVLCELADRLRACVRSSDAVFRFGGEEFVIILANTALDGALRLAERVRRSTARQPFAGTEAPIAVTASLGVATLEHDDETLSLFEKADEALYDAKAKGRNQVCRYHPSDNPVE